ncbi:MAG: glycosyltransferase [Christensenellales bacterium]
MKIALISDAGCVHTVRWANALAKRGNEVRVFSCGNHTPKDNSFDDSVKVVLLKFSAPLGYYLNAFQLRKAIKEYAPDVVNVHYASGYGTLGRWAGQKNAMLSVWGSDVYDYPYLSAFNMHVITKNLSYYRYMASTSHCMARQSKKLVDRQFYITPFGVDTKAFTPKQSEERAGYLIGTVKTLDDKYGIDVSIKAFVKLLDLLKDNGHGDIADEITYEIYGRGNKLQQLQELAQGLGVGDKVKFMGYVENKSLPSVLNRFDVFCCTSRMDSESFGVAVVEAMACGVPAVTSDVDGFAEVMVDGETGRIVEREDYQATAQALYDLIVDQDLRKRYGAAGRRRVEELYDWDDNVDNMLGIYGEIIEGNK